MLYPIQQIESIQSVEIIDLAIVSGRARARGARARDPRTAVHRDARAAIRGSGARGEYRARLPGYTCVGSEQ